MIEDIEKMFQAGEVFQQSLREDLKTRERDKALSGISPELYTLYTGRLEDRLEKLQQNRKVMLEQMDAEIEQLQGELARAQEQKPS